MVMIDAFLSPVCTTLWSEVSPQMKDSITVHMNRPMSANGFRWFWTDSIRDTEIALFHEGTI